MVRKTKGSLGTRSNNDRRKSLPFILILSVTIGQMLVTTSGTNSGPMLRRYEAKNRTETHFNPFRINDNIKTSTFYFYIFR